MTNTNLICCSGIWKALVFGYGVSDARWTRPRTTNESDSSGVISCALGEHTRQVPTRDALL